MAGTEIERTVDGSLDSQTVLSYIESGGAVQISLVQENPDDVAARITARLLGADSAEELFGETKVLHARDYLNKGFELRSVEFRASDIEGEGFPFYAVLQITDDNGEVHAMTCGAKSVLTKAAIAAQKGFLPTWVKIVKSEKPTEAGYFPLDMVAASSPENPF